MVHARKVGTFKWQNSFIWTAVPNLPQGAGWPQKSAMVSMPLGALFRQYVYWFHGNIINKLNSQLSQCVQGMHMKRIHKMAVAIWGKTQAEHKWIQTRENADLTLLCGNSDMLDSLSTHAGQRTHTLSTAITIPDTEIFKCRCLQS